MYDSCMKQRDPVSPKQFTNLQYEQKEKQEEFIRNAIERVNTCLLEIAGGHTPSPYYGRGKGSGGDYDKNLKEYADFLESDYARGHNRIVPVSGLIHIELCYLSCVAPPSVLETLRLLLIAAGWGENTTVHMRACSTMVWASLEFVEEEEEFEPIDPETLKMLNGKMDKELREIALSAGIYPHSYVANKVERNDLIAAIRAHADKKNIDDESPLTVAVDLHSMDEDELFKVAVEEGVLTRRQAKKKDEDELRACLAKHFGLEPTL